MSRIHIETDRLRLREHELDDLTAHHALLSDPQAMRYLPELRTYTLEQSRRNLEAAITEADSSNRTKVFLVIEYRDTCEHIGEMGYTIERATPQGKIAGVGYFLRQTHWGKRIASEALSALLKYAFDEGEIFRMQSGCLMENAASERVMQKCGMIREAVRPKFQWHEGELKDRVEYRLLRDEYLLRHTPVAYREIGQFGRERVNDFLRRQWGSTDMVIRGRIFDLTAADGIAVESDGELIGLITWVRDGDALEITSLDSLRAGMGIGSELMDRAADSGRALVCKLLRLITTNDNVEALRFYQRRGFVLSALYCNALAASRALKPQISKLGEHGIPLRDEIELVLQL